MTTPPVPKPRTRFMGTASPGEASRSYGRIWRDTDAPGAGGDTNHRPDTGGSDTQDGGLIIVKPATDEDSGSPLYKKILSVQHTEKDPDVLLIWWQNVSSWDDLENHPKCGVEWSEDTNVFTEKARRIQNAVQLYDLLLNRHGESLKNLISDLLSIADNLDKVSKGTKIAGITGGATGALGGVAAVAGVVLAPFTLGASLALTVVGVGVATAGGVTGASAAIANKVNVTQDRKKIEKILQDYMSQVKDIEDCLKFINRGMESLRKHNLATLTELNSQAVRVAKVLAEAGSSVWAIEASSSKASEMLGGFALGMDFYFSGSDGQKLKKGLESKFARKIRQVAQKLGAGLDDLMKVKKLFEKSLVEM